MEEPKENCSYKENPGQRNARGGSIAEFGPALFLIFVVALFPLLNVIGLALKYADCYFLYNIVSREAGVATIIHQNPSTNPPSITSVDLSASTNPNGSVNNVIKTWQQSGMGAFANVVSTPTQTCTVDNAEGTATARFVHVQLTVICNPFLKLPLPPIPGFSAPITFQYNGRTTVENLRNF